MKKTKNGLLLLILILAGFTMAASGQYCPGSQLAYIVRDSNGKIIDPTSLDAPEFINEWTTAISYADIDKSDRSWG